MPELRWILIVFGAALLLGIYLWGRRSSRQAAADEDALTRPPEPHAAFAFREEPSEEGIVREISADDQTETSGADIEPIIANRRQPRIELDEVAGDRFATEEAGDPSPPPYESRRGRIEPSLGDEPIVNESILNEPGPAPHAAAAAPTLSMSSTPAPRRPERRKIIALRIAAGAQRFAGEQLLAAIEAEGLQHGKYDVFHRIDASGATIFSVASMVEPGTFDPLRMAGESFPGITLFTQFPGACESMHAFNELVLTARRLQEQLGGTLQDERAVPLTIHRLERLRQDIRDFEQGHGRDVAQRAETAPTSP